MAKSALVLYNNWTQGGHGFHHRSSGVGYTPVLLGMAASLAAAPFGDQAVEKFVTPYIAPLIGGLLDE